MSAGLRKCVPAKSTKQENGKNYQRVGGCLWPALCGATDFAGTHASRLQSEIGQEFSDA
jgi:hypothetical protein